MPIKPRTLIPFYHITTSMEYAADQQKAAIRKYLRRTARHLALTVLSAIVTRAASSYAQRAGIAVLAWHFQQTLHNGWKMIAIARVRC